jgi:hypothetical protein
LRDFDDRSNNEQVIKHIIEEEIDHIWKEIYKPAEHLFSSTAGDFFDFEFVMLPHKIF